MHKAYPFENVSWIDFPFLTNSRHTKAYKIGIGSEKKAVDLACSIGFTIEKQRWLKRIRKNRTRKKDAFETRDFVESCIDCISKFYWKCTLRLFDSPIENATMLHLCIVWTSATSWKLALYTYVYRWVETVVTEMNQFTCIESGYEIALSQNLKRLFVQNLPNKNKQSDVCHWSILWCFNVYCIMQVAFSSRR